MVLAIGYPPTLRQSLSTFNTVKGEPPMFRILLLASAMVASSLLHAGPKEDALAAYEKFFPAFVLDNEKELAGMFAPDAQFYGTLSRELVTKPEGVLQYFATALSGPAVVKALPLSATATAVSDTVVVIAGTWKNERVLDGKTITGGPFRNTAVLQKRGDRWLIVQFHNSFTPSAPSPPAAR
jgi:hypothetical protein